MKFTKSIPAVLFISLSWACQTERSKETAAIYEPWNELGTLFHDVQMASVFPDSKTFADCVPLSDPASIVQKYHQQKNTADFDLSVFVSQNFELPESPKTIQVNTDRPVDEHLTALWDDLTRSAQNQKQFSTLITLPQQYVVPGGRFREIYYWDSYFTMIGLGVSGRTDLIKSMLDNFKYLIETFGYIPNGNRSYFIGRSQPPYFGLMVNLYVQYTSPSDGLQYLDALQKEYDFWMDGGSGLTEEKSAYRRVVLYNGVVLNRYWDDRPEPRPESYKEDIELADGKTPEEAQLLYRNLRAACESGWDFSTRWFADPTDFASIRTTEILPVDLNSLLYSLENLLAGLYNQKGDQELHRKYLKLAENRYNAINELFWSTEQNRFQDIIWTEGSHTKSINAASFFPLFCKIAQRDLAELQHENLLPLITYPGGIVTTVAPSGQQWDAPNGWAPLQWVTIKGLEHYGFDSSAIDITKRWVSVNTKVFSSTGKMMEKYNVADTTLLAGGGEYPTQDGFGWSNGVLLGLLADSPKY